MFDKNVNSEGKNTEVDLNRVVTPMLDMTFQILFFLIMNFRMPTAEGQINLSYLPRETGETVATIEETLSPTNDEYLLRIYIYERDGNREGERQGLIVGMALRQKGEKIAQAELIERLDSSNAPDERNRGLDPLMYGLATKLRPYQPKDGGKQPNIKIECPKKLRYSELLRVMDVMRQMKFENIGVVPVAKDNQ